MSKATSDLTDVTAAAEMENPESALVDPSRCPPWEILVNIGSILLDNRQYRSLASLSAGSIYFEDALKLIGGKFRVIDGQTEELDALAIDVRTVHIQHLLFTGTVNAQSLGASNWPSKQRAKENGQRALKGVGYWCPVEPIVASEGDAAVLDPAEPIQFYRCINVLSETVEGTAAQILDLDQAADMLLQASEPDSNFDKRKVQFNLLWNDSDDQELAQPSPNLVQAPLPSMAVFGSYWILNFDSTSDNGITWAAGLARLVIGGLAVNCEPLGKWAAPGSRIPFHRPELVIVGVSSLRAAKVILEMLSDLYKVRASAVRVRVSIEIELPIACVLPSVEEIVDMLRTLTPELARGVWEQDLWDWKNHVCKPDIRIEIFVANGDESVVKAFVGIEYPTIVQRNYHIGKKPKPDRVIAMRVHVERQEGEATDDSDGDEEGTEPRVERQIFRQ